MNREELIPIWKLVLLFVVVTTISIIMEYGLGIK